MKPPQTHLVCTHVCVCQTSQFGRVAHNFGPYLHAHVVQGDQHILQIFLCFVWVIHNVFNGGMDCQLYQFHMWMALGGIVTPFLIVLICNNVCVCCKLCFKLLFSRLRDYVYCHLFLFVCCSVFLWAGKNGCSRLLGGWFYINQIKMTAWWCHDFQ